MKKALSLLLALVMCLSMLVPISAQAATEDTEAFVWTEGWGVAVLIGIVVVLLVSNLICFSVNKKYFGGMFSFIIGGLWGWAVLILVCLLVPGAKPFLVMLIEALIGMDGVVIPDYHTIWYWLILLVCAGYAVIIWIGRALGIEKNPVLATVLMLIMGAVHATALYVLAAVVIKALVVAILLAVVIAPVAGRNTDSKKPNVTATAVYGWGTKDLEVDETGTFYKDPETDEWIKIKRDY